MSKTMIRELSTTELNQVAGGFNTGFDVNGGFDHQSTYFAGSLNGGHNYGAEFGAGRGFGFQLFTGLKGLFMNIMTP